MVPSVFVRGTEDEESCGEPGEVVMKKLLVSVAALCVFAACADLTQAAWIQQGVEEPIVQDGEMIGRAPESFYVFGKSTGEGWWEDGVGVQFSFKYNGSAVVPYAGGFSASNLTEGGLDWANGNERFVASPGLGAKWGNGYAVGYVVDGFDTKMDISSSFAFDGLLGLAVANTYAATADGGDFDLVVTGYDAAGNETGTFSTPMVTGDIVIADWIDIDLGAFSADTTSFAFSFVGDGGTPVFAGNTVAMDYKIPEPGTYAMLCGLGLVGAAWYRRRRRNAK